MLQVALFYADPCIADAENGVVVLNFDLQQYLAPAVGVGDGIIDEVHDDLNEAHFITENGGRLFGLDFQGNAFFSCQWFGCGSHIANQEIEAHRFLFE